MLHFCRQDIYVILRDRPEDLLDAKIDTGTKQAVYTLRYDSVDNIVKHMKVRDIGTHEMELLRKCFRQPKCERTHFMVFVNSYQNYFCLVTPNAIISKAEFEKLLTDRSCIRKIIHDWFWKITPKKGASLYSRMMSVRTKELTLEQWKDHLFVIYAWMCEGDDENIADVMTDFVKKDNLRLEGEDDDVVMNDYAMWKMKSFISSQNVNRINVAKVLSGYYGHTYGSTSDYLIDGNEIKETAGLNFSCYMEERTTDQDAINVIALNGNELNEFVKANCALVEGSLKDNDMFVGENLVIDKVTSYFAGRKEKSSHKKDAETMYEKGTGHYKISWYVDGKVLDDEKKLVFGNDESKYKLFLVACFLEWKKEE